MEISQKDIENIAKALKLIPKHGPAQLSVFLENSGIKIPKEILEVESSIDIFNLDDFSTKTSDDLIHLARVFRFTYLNFDKKFIGQTLDYINSVKKIDEFLYILRKIDSDDPIKTKIARATDKLFKKSIIDFLINNKVSYSTIPKFMNTAYFTQESRLDYLKMLFIEGREVERKVFRDHKAGWIRRYYSKNCPDKELPFLLSQKNVNDTYSNAIIQARINGHDVKGLNDWTIYHNFKQGKYN